MPRSEQRDAVGVARDALQHGGRRPGRELERRPFGHAPSERAELAHECGLGIPAREPSVGEQRDPPPPEAAVGVGGQPRDGLAVVGRDPVEVRGGPLERHLSRAVGGGDEQDVGIAAGDLAQGETVDLEGAAGDDRVDVLALDQLPGRPG